MITAVTCTGDRQETFKLCQRWMAEQTLKPDQWLVIDDGKEPTWVPVEAEYIRREPGINDPKHTLILNLGTVLSFVEGDQIIFWEDDEYYAPSYIDEMIRQIKKYEVVGIAPSRYYHLFSGRYYDGDNISHASLAQTGIQKSFLSEFKKMFPGNQFIDSRIWAKLREEKRGFLFSDKDNPLYVAMKGMMGRPGIGNGHTNIGGLYLDSPNKEILRKWIRNPEHLKVYLDLSKKYEIKEGEPVFMGRYRAITRGFLSGLGLVEPGQEFEYNGKPGKWMVPIKENLPEHIEPKVLEEPRTMHEMTTAFAEKRGIVPPPGKGSRNIPRPGQTAKDMVKKDADRIWGTGG